MLHGGCGRLLMMLEKTPVLTAAVKLQEAVVVAEITMGLVVAVAATAVMVKGVWGGVISCRVSLKYGHSLHLCPSVQGSV